ncbi:unnamed protein product, partial [Vitis vinifera]|uniref:Uncharacterized protein n=1 Tax=Vitis vinifera TaxID=29760 RepID=D7TD84_VITVI
MPLFLLFQDLFAIATNQPIHFSSTITFVLKAFSTLEGIGYSLDPDFSFEKIVAPYAQEFLYIQQERRTGPQLVHEIMKQVDDPEPTPCHCLIVSRG